MKVVVNVRLKSGVLDPQGKAVEHALASLGFDSINSVRIGKQIVLDVKEADENDIKKDIEKMCEELLTNTVIEDYEIVL